MSLAVVKTGLAEYDQEILLTGRCSLACACVRACVCLRVCECAHSIVHGCTKPEPRGALATILVRWRRISVDSQYELASCHPFGD